MADYRGVVKGMKKQYKAFMKSREWREMRKRRMEYDDHTCRGCGQCGRPGNELTVHHRNYDRFGGDERLQDLVTLCKGCHGTVEEFKGRM